MTFNPLNKKVLPKKDTQGIPAKTDTITLDERVNNRPEDRPKPEIIDVDENGITTDEHGVKRNGNLIVKGSAAIPNSGRGGKKNSSLSKYMKQMEQVHGDRAVNILYKIALYDWELAEKQHNEMYKNWDKKPQFKPRVTTAEQLTALKEILDRGMGKAASKVDIDKRETLEIGPNMLSASEGYRLLQEKKKLQLIQGGKNEDEDIIDIEEVINEYN